MLICYYLESNYNYQHRNRIKIPQPQESRMSTRVSVVSKSSGSLTPPIEDSDGEQQDELIRPVDLNNNETDKPVQQLLAPPQIKSRAESIDSLIERREKLNEMEALKKELFDLQQECTRNQLYTTRQVDKAKMRAAIEERIQARLIAMNDEDYFDNFSAFVPDVELPVPGWNRKATCVGCQAAFPSYRRSPRGYQGRGEMIYSQDYYQHVYTCPEYRVSGICTYVYRMVLNCNVLCFPGHMCYCLRCSLAFVHYKDFHAHQFEHCDDFFVLTTRSASLNAQIIV